MAGEALNPSADEETPKSLSPTLPPLAPVRPCPYASSGAWPAGQLAAPRPTLGGQDYPAIPSAQKQNTAV